MKVQLAYPYTDDDGKEHEPDDVIEVDDATGARLKSEGRAREPDAPKSRAAKSDETSK